MFNIDDEETNNIDSVRELRKILKTHNLKFLLLLSGLKNRFEDEKAINRNFIKVNSLLFSNWNEQVRYKPCGFMQQDDIIVLINLLKGENGLIKWIDQQN